MNIKNYLCYIHSFWISFCVDFLSANSEILNTSVGSTAVLPCKLSHVSSQNPYINWRTDFMIVFERMGKDFFVGPGYEGRVDVSEDELLKGNCSLVLKDIRLTDAGIYRSYLRVRRTRSTSSKSWSFIYSVELKVKEDSSRVPSHPLLTPSTSAPRDDAGRISANPLFIIIIIISMFILSFLH